MPWVRVDDDFPDHPKVAQAGPLAGWLYVCGLAYSARFLTDGFVPDGQVRRLADVDDPGDLAARLVSVGLWERVDGGFRIHDYHEYQPSAAKVKAERQAAAERMRRGRSGEQPTPPDNRSAEVPANNERTSAEVPLPRTHPVPIRENPEPDAGAGARENAGPTPLRPGPKPTKTATRTADGWEPSDDHRRIAAELRLDFGRELALFRDYVPNRKDPYKDLDAGFRTFLRRAPDFGRALTTANGRASPRGQPRGATDWSNLDEVLGV